MCYVYPTYWDRLRDCGWWIYKKCTMMPVCVSQEWRSSSRYIVMASQPFWRSLSRNHVFSYPVYSRTAIEWEGWWVSIGVRFIPFSDKPMWNLVSAANRCTGHSYSWFILLWCLQFWPTNKKLRTLKTGLLNPIIAKWWLQFRPQNVSPWSNPVCWLCPHSIPVQITRFYRLITIHYIPIISYHIISP
jgi:hypothetical protein